MALRITLKPNEIIFINGCEIENGPKRTEISIKSQAQVVRRNEMITLDEANTLPKQTQYLLQALMLSDEEKDVFTKQVQKNLGSIAAQGNGEILKQAVEAANYVSVGNYYLAFKKVQIIIKLFP